MSYAYGIVARYRSPPTPTQYTCLLRSLTAAHTLLTSAADHLNISMRLTLPPPRDALYLLPWGSHPPPRDALYCTHILDNAFRYHSHQ